MKKLTYDQRKWGLTVFLLAALGFNVSFNGENSQKPFGSSDLASKSVDSKFASDDGKTYDVQYIERDGKVVAIVPYAAEGKACDTGECVSSHVLDTKFTDDVKSLEAALRKDMKTAKPAEEKVAQKDSEEDKEAKIKSDDQTITDAINTKCNKKADDKVLDCKVNELVKVLRKTSSSKTLKLSKESALDFYKEEIESELIAYMADPTNAYLGYELVGKLQTDISRDYSALRSRVALDAVQAVRSKAVEIQNTIRQAEQYKQSGNIQGALQTNSQAATMMSQTLPAVYQGLDSAMYNSLSQAVSQRLINSQDALNIINNMYRNSAMPIYSGIIMNPSTYQIPAMTLDVSGMLPAAAAPGVQIQQGAQVAPAVVAPAVAVPQGVVSGSVRIIQSNNGSITGPAGSAPVTSPGAIIIQRH